MLVQGVGLREVHYVESNGLVLEEGWLLNAEVEPLLDSFGIGVNPHVEVVF
jgi:hypothetical protein